jgi:hypothetical protein
MVVSNPSTKAGEIMINTSEKRIAGSVIRLHPSHNVAVARIDVGVCSVVPAGRLMVASN